jgi:hypothetical protein
MDSARLQAIVADPAALEAEMRAIQKQYHVTGRTCGECTACCTVMAITELSKDNYTPCPNCAGKSCMIYDARPTTCRGWSCEWWLGRLGLNEDQRPDKLGVIFTHDADSVLAFEITPGSAMSPPALQVMDQVKRKYPLKFNPAGGTDRFPMGRGDARGEILAGTRSKGAGPDATPSP